MSLAISSNFFAGVPTISDAQMIAIADELNDELETQEYFCANGHAFSLDFLPGVDIPVCWECPTCTAVAANHPL